MSKYRVFSGPNAGKIGPEETPYLDTFDAVPNSKNTPKSSGILLM